MGNRGRPRKPTALKVLHGDFEKNPNRRPKGEPVVDDGTPKMPTHLDRLARNEWRRICEELRQLKVLTTVERGALEQYCVAYSEWRQAVKTAREQGRYFTTDTGLKEHPASKTMRALAVICHKYLSEFGLTPSSRTRLQVTETTAASDLESKYFG